MVGDSKKILRFAGVPGVTHAGVFGLALGRPIRSLGQKRVFACGSRFRPPFFTFQQNRIIPRTGSFHRDFAGLVARLFAAGFPLRRKFLDDAGRVGIDGFPGAAAVDLGKGKQAQDQKGADTDCGHSHRVSPHWVKTVYLPSYNKINGVSIHFHLQEISFYI